MASVLVTVADAVTDKLNGHSFGREFAAERSYATWDEALSDADADLLKVDVVPSAMFQDVDLGSRGSTAYVVSADILVRRCMRKYDQEAGGKVFLGAVDDLVQFVQDIHEFLSHEDNRSLSGLDSATWRSTTIPRAWSRANLRDNRMFSGIVRVSYDVDVEYA